MAWSTAALFAFCGSKYDSPARRMVKIKRDCTAAHSQTSEVFLSKTKSRSPYNQPQFALCRKTGGRNVYTGWLEGQLERVAARMFCTTSDAVVVRSRPLGRKAAFCHSIWFGWS